MKKNCDKPLILIADNYTENYILDICYSFILLTDDKDKTREYNHLRRIAARYLADHTKDPYKTMDNLRKKFNIY